MGIITITPGHPWAQSEDCIEWCREHGVEAGEVYRIDLHVQSRTAVVYQYSCDERGRHFIAGDEIAMSPPILIAVKRLPLGVGAD